MASLINRGGRYYAQWHDASRNPSSKRHSLGTKDRRLASRLLARLEEANKLGSWDPWRDSVAGFLNRPSEYKRVGETVALFFAHKRLHLREETIYTYESILDRMSHAVGERTLLERVEQEPLDAFVNEVRLSANTKRLRYRVARSFFNWCVREGHLGKNPLLRVVQAKVEGKVPRVVRAKDLKRICQKLEEDYFERVGTAGPHRVHEGELIWLAPLFWFAYYTGMRLSELARLRWEHIDAERGVIVIPLQKNRKEDLIPLNAHAKRVLAKVERGDPEGFVFRAPRQRGTVRHTKAFKNHVEAAFARYRDKAGLSDRLTFHGLRHGFCTALAEAGKSAYLIKEAARHSHIGVSMVYVDLTVELVRAEVEDAFSSESP